MDEAYAKVYGELARQHWWWQVRDREIERALWRLGLASTQCRILDVGCGDGRLFPLLERFGDVSGLEPDPTTFGTPAPDPRIRHAPFTAPLPFDGRFDLVTLFDVLEHLDDRVGALRLVRDALRPGGTVLITVPAFQSLWTNHDVMNHHRTRYSAGQLASECRAAGLLPGRPHYHFHALVIPKLLARLHQLVVRPSPHVPTVPASLLNSAARAWFTVEGQLARPFNSWLPGTSLFATATRPAG